MQIRYAYNYAQMSQWASDSLFLSIGEKPDLLLCTATGNSPIGLYKNMGEAYQESPGIFDRLRIVKLDEWGGIPMEEADSCESFIQHKILGPLNIPKSRYISFNSDPTDPEMECARVENEIGQGGAIDVCILGLGQNGHIGFNEPAEFLEPYCHIAKLSPESLQHNMTRFMTTKPKYGLTLGMATILRSKKIILLITGSGKKEIIAELLTKKITTHLPASLLWLHPQTECLVDRSCL